MTSMPEMVALFNGSGGIASLFVGWAALYNTGNTTFTIITVLLSVLIGGMTFSGSIIAWGKLSEVMTSSAIVFGAQRIVNAALLAVWLSAASCSHGSVADVPLFLCGHRAQSGLWRDGGHPDRRGRYAGGDLAVEQLFGARRGGRWIRDQQHHPDRRRIAGWRCRHHSHQHHVQSHEPVAGERAVFGLRCGQDSHQGGRRGQTHYRR